MKRLLENMHYVVNFSNTQKKEDVLSSLEGLHNLSKCDCLDYFLFSFPKSPMELDREFVADSRRLGELIKSRAPDIPNGMQYLHVAKKPKCNVDEKCVRMAMDYSKCVSGVNGHTKN
jgi:hypothetical protein